MAASLISAVRKSGVIASGLSESRVVATISVAGLPGSPDHGFSGAYP